MKYRHQKDGKLFQPENTLREAFPSTFGGMYIAEESGYAEPENGQQYFVTREDEKIPMMQQEDLPESTVPKEEPQPIPTETEKEEPQQFFK